MIKTRLQHRIPLDTVKRLRATAKLRGVSEADLINQAIVELIEGTGDAKNIGAQLSALARNVEALGTSQLLHRELAHQWLWWTLQQTPPLTSAEESANAENARSAYEEIRARIDRAITGGQALRIELADPPPSERDRTAKASTRKTKQREASSVSEPRRTNGRRRVWSQLKLEKPEENPQ